MTATQTNPSDIIRLLMRHRGMAQEGLADVLGMAQPQVSRRLRGINDWRVPELVTIALDYNVPVTLMFGSEGAALRWLADYHDEHGEAPWAASDRARGQSTCSRHNGSFAPRLFDPDELPLVIDLRDRVVQTLIYEEPSALYANAS